WIEVGAPDAQRLHRGAKRAARAAVYTHRNIARVLADLDGKGIYRAAEIPVYEFGRGYIENVAAVLQRRVEMTVSVVERKLDLDVCGQSFTTLVQEHHFT